jgi:hypothetical protein
MAVSWDISTGADTTACGALSAGLGKFERHLAVINTTVSNVEHNSHRLGHDG